jgi:hypothetical protein
MKIITHRPSFLLHDGGDICYSEGRILITVGLNFGQACAFHFPLRSPRKQPACGYQQARAKPFRAGRNKLMFMQKNNSRQAIASRHGRLFLGMTCQLPRRHRSARPTVCPAATNIECVVERSQAVIQQSDVLLMMIIANIPFFRTG